VLRSDAPQIRTAEAVIAKHEQILDGLERGAVSNKTGEQMGQQLKGIMAVERLGISYLRMIASMGRKAAVPRTPILRSLIGLPRELSATDGEKVRALLPE
jgi:hypothetical protein